MATPWPGLLCCAFLLPFTPAYISHQELKLDCSQPLLFSITQEDLSGLLRVVTKWAWLVRAAQAQLTSPAPQDLGRSAVAGCSVVLSLHLAVTFQRNGW